jgi:hypothetical protein
VIIALCLTVLVLPVIAADEGQGVHAGLTVGAADNKGQFHGDKGDLSVTGDNNTFPTRTPGDGNRNNPPDTPHNISQIPGPKDQNGGDQGAARRNTSRVPPGWERNPNEVRDAVHSLLATENRTGGIGPQVSAIAREFNNSVNAGQQFGNRITNRNAFIRFFFGGDQQAANELANLTAQNQARINEIENLMNTTTLNADTRSMMDEQLQLLQQNVAFDQQLSGQAKQDRGIFGGFL